MSNETQHDLIVIGAGIAGLAASTYARRLGLSTAILESQLFGGLIVNVNELDGDSPGSGADLASAMMMEATDLGAEYLAVVATQVLQDGESIVVKSDAGSHRARAVIVATGAVLKKLHVPGEAELEHKGVSHCANCDGPLFHGKDVLVVGGGDSALQSALVLSNFCRRVHLVHRGERFRAKPHLSHAVASASNIEVRWHTVVEAVVGSAEVEAVRVRSLANQRIEDVPCSGFFAFVGLQPASDFLPPSIRRDDRGRIVTGDNLQTSIGRVYAAGAVRSGCGGVIADAVADGEAAVRAGASLLGLPPGAGV